METTLQAISALLFLGAIVGFSGGLTGELLYAARLLGERQRLRDELLPHDSPGASIAHVRTSGWLASLGALSSGWVAAWRVKRLAPEFAVLASESEIIARDLPRFLICRRVRQISFLACAVAIVFFGVE